MLEMAQKSALLTLSDQLDEEVSDLTNFRYEALVDSETLTNETIVEMLQDKLYWIGQHFEEVIRGLKSDNHEQAIQAMRATTY